MSMRLALRALALGAICAALNACAVAGKRADRATVDRVDMAPQVTPTPAPDPQVQTAMDISSSEPAPTSPWQRMRERFAMPGCDYSSEVSAQAARYARDRRAFGASWKAAMPSLLLVLDDIERRGLPAEFALLPYVESNYGPVRGHGKSPAGIWQLMPHTARERGIRIERDYDGRLDLIESTRVALDLIERYDREFGDWRLATMAFNAGEFRIKRVLGTQPGTALDAKELSRLKVSSTTHNHLTRMLALACVVADPGRFGITLPEPEADDALGVVAIEGPIDLRVAANFAGIPFDELQRLNAAHLGERTTDDAPDRLLLPNDHVESFSRWSQSAPSALGSRWRSVQVQREVPLEDIARQAEFDPHVLAAANGFEPTTQLSIGTSLLVPDDPETDSRLPVVNRASATHTVMPGDTLSAIARRYGVRIAQLLNWNSLRIDGVLRQGARLRVGAP